MVINTGSCVYTDMKIWPGRGSKFISRDGKTFFFIGSKARSLYQQKIKSVKLRWTQSWRRRNKKGKAEVTKKRRVKRQVQKNKAIVGATLDEIRKRREEKPELRQTMREQALKEIKERQKKKVAQSQPQRHEKQAKAQPKVVKKGKKGR